MPEKNLIIGFEFEFGWNPSNKVSRRPKSKAAYFEQVVRPELELALKSAFEEKLSCVEDCTVRFDQKKQYWNTSFGAEVVTLPMPADKAMSFLNKFLSWMQSHPQIKTNNTCSLHVNISYKERDLNKTVSYWNLLQTCPQEEILKQFKRTNNKFSKPFSKVRFPLRAQSYCTALKSYAQWQRIAQRPFSNIALKAVPLKYGWESYEVNKENAVTHKFDINTKDFIKILRSELDHVLENSKKSLAIVKKQTAETAENAESYYEFRMIGGQGYELKENTIVSTINTYIESFEASQGTGCMLK